MKTGYLKAVLLVLGLLVSGCGLSPLTAAAVAVVRAGRIVPQRIPLVRGCYSPNDQWSWFCAAKPGTAGTAIFIGAAGPAVWPFASFLPIPHYLGTPASWRRPNIGFRAAAMMRNGKTLAATVWKRHFSRGLSVYSRRIGMWDLRSGNAIRRLPIRHIGMVRSMAFSPGDRWLAIGGRLFPDDCRGFLVNATDGKMGCRLRLPAALNKEIKHRPSGMAFGPGHSLLVVMGRWLCSWQVPGGTLIYAVKTQQRNKLYGPGSLMLTGHGRRILIADNQVGRVQWRSVRNGRLIHQWHIHFPGRSGYWRRIGIMGAAVLNSGKYVVCVVQRKLDDLQRGRVLIVDAKTGYVVAASRTAMACFWGISVASGGTYLITWGDLGVRLWKVPAGLSD